jgi:hypothetical protein
MIQNVFNECPQLIGVKVAEEYKIIEADLKTGWSIPNNNDIQSDKKPSKKSGVDYYMFYSVNKNIDELVDWLQEEVIKPNVENEQKQKLLKEKVNELKQMFQNTSLEDLEKLRFTSEEDALKITPKKKEEEKTEEVSFSELEAKIEKT